MPSLGAGGWVQQTDPNIANAVPPHKTKLARGKARRVKESLSLKCTFTAIPNTGEVNPLSQIFCERLPSWIDPQIRLKNLNRRFWNLCGLIEKSATHRNQVPQIGLRDTKLHPKREVAFSDLPVDLRGETVHADRPGKESIP